MDYVRMARADYSKMDAGGSTARIRLNSTAVHVQHVNAADISEGVQVAYVRGGEVETVSAKNRILAIYNGMIPYLCPELPEKQKESLSYLVKAPLVYTHVALRNWTSFAKLGVHHIVAPGAYHTYAALDYPVSLGGDEVPRQTEQTIAGCMFRPPCKAGPPNRA